MLLPLRPREPPFRPLRSTVPLLPRQIPPYGLELLFFQVLLALREPLTMGTVPHSAAAAAEAMQ